MRVPAPLIREKQPITPDTALRLARVFGTTPEFWMNLQTQHDQSVAAIAAREELAAIKAVEAAWASIRPPPNPPP